MIGKLGYGQEKQIHKTETLHFCCYVCLECTKNITLEMFLF